MVKTGLQEVQGAAVPRVAAWWRSQAGMPLGRGPLWLAVGKSQKKLQSAELQEDQGAAVPRVAAWWRSLAGMPLGRGPLWLVVEKGVQKLQKVAKY